MVANREPGVCLAGFPRDMLTDPSMPEELDEVVSRVTKVLSTGPGLPQSNNISTPTSHASFVQSVNDSDFCSFFWDWDLGRPTRMGA